eukprot:COSAG04_NODE_154_length_22391_cov_6.579760_7_plen_318_part_00
MWARALGRAASRPAPRLVALNGRRATPARRFATKAEPAKGLTQQQIAGAAAGAVGLALAAKMMTAGGKKPDKPASAPAKSAPEPAAEPAAAASADWDEDSPEFLAALEALAARIEAVDEAVSGMRSLAEHAADAAGRVADFADGVAELAERVNKAEDAAATYSKPEEDVDLDDPRVVAALEALSAKLEKLEAAASKDEKKSEESQKDATVAALEALSAKLEKLEKAASKKEEAAGKKEASVPSAPEIVWQWQAGKSGWKDYSAKDSAAIEDAFKRGHAKAKLGDYHVLLKGRDAMKQVKKSDYKRSRKVRRHQQRVV